MRARDTLRTLPRDRAALLRETKSSVGSAVNGVERQSIRSARDNPAARSDRSSIASRDLIADRISKDAIRATPLLATFAAQFLIILISIGLDALR
jgi:hypothetical protein